MSVSCSPTSSSRLSSEILYRPNFRPYTYRRRQPTSAVLARPESAELPGRRLPLTPPVCRSRPRLSRRTGERRNLERSWTIRWGERWTSSNTEADRGLETANVTYGEGTTGTTESRVPRSSLEEQRIGNEQRTRDETETENSRICGICLETPRDIFWCPHCLQPWCTPCITRWSRTSPRSSCPNCRRPLEIATYPTHAFSQVVEASFEGQTEQVESVFSSCMIHREELAYFDMRRNRQVCIQCILEQRQRRFPAENAMSIDTSNVNYFSQPYMPELHMGNQIQQYGNTDGDIV